MVASLHALRKIDGGYLSKCFDYFNILTAADTIAVCSTCRKIPSIDLLGVCDNIDRFGLVHNILHETIDALRVDPLQVAETAYLIDNLTPMSSRTLAPTLSSTTYSSATLFRPIVAV